MFRGLVVLADCLVMSYTASASYPRSARRAADPGEAPLRDCAESLRPGHYFQRELDDAKDARATLAKYTQKRFIVLCIRQPKPRDFGPHTPNPTSEGAQGAMKSFFFGGET